MCKGFETQGQDRRPRTGGLVDRYRLHWYELDGADRGRRHHLHHLIESFFLRSLLQSCWETFWPSVCGPQHAWIGVPKEASSVRNGNVAVKTMISWKISSGYDVNHLPRPVFNGKQEAQVLSFSWDIPGMKPEQCFTWFRMPAVAVECQ